MRASRPKVFFLATVEFAVNAFLLSHLKVLSKCFDVTVIVNTDDPLFLTQQGVDVKVVPLRISRNIRILSDAICLIRLVYIFFKFRPSVVHSITPKAGILAMLAAFITRVPLSLHTFTGQVWANKKGIKKILLKLVDKLIGNLSTMNIVDSHSQRDFLVAENVLSPSKTIVFGNGSVSGVDLKKFKPSKRAYAEVRCELSIPKDAFVFIYLGRLNAEKGVLDLAAAFSQIHDDKAYLLVVGPDEGGYGQQIKDLCSMNLGRVRLVGFSNEQHRYFAASNVLCLPSYREGFGSVIIEAAAMGIPTIGSDIYGISDAVLNRKTGLLCPPKNPNQLLKCMELFLSSPDLVSQYGAAARERAINEFDANILTKCWLDFYQTRIR